jgi:hypothetical protein
MTRFRHWLIAAAIVCWLAALTLISLYFGWFTWAATPSGKNTLAGVMFVALATWLASVAVHDAKRRRLSREVQEWDANTEWFERIHEPVRRITQAEMHAESERLWAELEQTSDYPPQVEDERLTTTVAPSSAPAPQWGQRATPLEHDYILSYTGPSRLRSRPMAEVDMYIGAAAWTAHEFRSGQPVVDTVFDHATKVLRGMTHVIDAPVSPAAEPVYKPRHKSELVGQGVITGTQTQRWQWENEATGSWPIVRELVGAGVS